MRTTISIDDGLLEDAKLRASDAKISLSELIANALREALTKPRRPTHGSAFKLVTFGHEGLLPGVSLDRVHEVFDADDGSSLNLVGAGADDHT